MRLGDYAPIPANWYTPILPNVPIRPIQIAVGVVAFILLQFVIVLISGILFPLPPQDEFDEDGMYIEKDRHGRQLDRSIPGPRGRRGQSHRRDALSRRPDDAGDAPHEGALCAAASRAHQAAGYRRAEAAPGVVAVLTAKDVPVNEFGLIVYDAPVLAIDTVRWIGEKVALVVAETEKQAARARDLIEVEYEDLPVVSDPREAMQLGAPQLHASRDKENNVLVHYRIRKGDVDEAFQQADVIVEGTYHTPFQEHAFLQPEAGLAYIDEEGRVTVQVAGQWTHEDQEQIAHALNLPHEQVRVIYPAIGGAFGGREDMSVQIILALAAWHSPARLKRPVKIVWSREESIIGHHKRHQMFFKTRWGATKEGQLVAAEVEAISDAGRVCVHQHQSAGQHHVDVHRAV